MKIDYGAWRRDSEEFYSEHIRKIAAARVRGLMQYSIIHNNPLAKLLESAYLQGIVDAAESMNPANTEGGDGI